MYVTIFVRDSRVHVESVGTPSEEASILYVLHSPGLSVFTASLNGMVMTVLPVESNVLVLEKSATG